MYFAFQAILRMFKRFPETFVYLLILTVEGEQLGAPRMVSQIWQEAENTRLATQPLRKLSLKNLGKIGVGIFCEEN
jgi:hypothetical protein